MEMMNASVSVAKFGRKITITVFKDDTKEELQARYASQLAEGEDSCVLGQILSVAVFEEAPVTLCVETAPFGCNSYMLEDSGISTVEDLCDKLAEITVMVLRNKEKRCRT